MNTLTHKGVLAEDRLFATLGTSVGKMWLAPSMENLQRENTSLASLTKEVSEGRRVIEAEKEL